jgi:hypothetical protein
MHPTARQPLVEEAASARRWWVAGLVWWALFLGVLVVAVHECS